ncbi:putative Prolyl 4-hydroxylase alpha subunit [Zostera marina]|uniref:procollagen-proline 4-dioxygenase n=1 Tax=Zostera marina TaxID=29655 RepID=A0A0K9P2A5_ZOSMR|nr:putative Prolyl 4-hydroxylase alpha subunit [Zostera marina]
MGIFLVFVFVFFLLLSVTVLSFVLVPEQLQLEQDSNNNGQRNASSLDSGSGDGNMTMRVDISQVTQILKHPKAFIYQRFLFDEECDHIIGLAKDKLKKSEVITTDDVEIGMISDERTSSDTFLELNQDEVVSRIERRIATWTFLPEGNGEGIQVLRYEKDEKNDPHYDSYGDNTTSGHRMATLIMYLSDVQKGGETVFPLGKENDKEDDDTWSDCAKKGYAVKPKRGDALLFFNLHPNSTEDMDSLHGGCPVIQGVKWSATKWIHVNPYGVIKKPSGCADEKEECTIWAEDGECQKNPEFMLGTKFSVGNCLKSCNVC